MTCGGLCPGINVVIRELVMSLRYNYGVKIFMVSNGAFMDLLKKIVGLN